MGTSSTPASVVRYMPTPGLEEADVRRGASCATPNTATPSAATSAPRQDRDAARAREHHDRAEEQRRRSRGRAPAMPQRVCSTPLKSVRRGRLKLTQPGCVFVDPGQEDGGEEQGAGDERQDGVADPVAAQETGLLEPARTLHASSIAHPAADLERARGALEGASNAADRGGIDLGGTRDEASHECGARRAAGARPCRRGRRLRAAGARPWRTPPARSTSPRTRPSRPS